MSSYELERSHSLAIWVELVVNARILKFYNFISIWLGLVCFNKILSSYFLVLINHFNGHSVLSQ